MCICIVSFNVQAYSYREKMTTSLAYTPRLSCFGYGTSALGPEPVKFLVPLLLMCLPHTVVVVVGTDGKVFAEGHV